MIIIRNFFKVVTISWLLYVLLSCIFIRIGFKKNFDLRFLMDLYVVRLFECDLIILDVFLFVYRASAICMAFVYLLNFVGAVTEGPMHGLARNFTFN